MGAGRRRGKHGDGRKRSGGVMIGDLEGFAFEYKENGRTLILGGGFSKEKSFEFFASRIF